MQQFLREHHRPAFYCTWIVLSLLQASFTELQDDEAYYWVFSQYLDWGYFDHPPMIALVIKTGTTFFTNELAVRLVPLMLNALTLYIIERIIDNKNPFLFYAICFSMAVLQVAGFMAVPDIPLMFFTALFFLVYKHYLQKGSWMNVLLLGLVAACLLYSKYHGVLILFFVLISNFSLLKDRRVYIAGFLALFFFSFHLWWQYQHGWISFKYHLFESNVKEYQFRYTTEFILGQFLLAGPIAGFILIPATLLYKTKNVLERSLKFTAIGIFAFFFLSSFRGEVEANWTSPVLIPIIILSHLFLGQRTSWRRWIYRLLPVTIAIVLLFRIAMVFDIIPHPAVSNRFHAWKDWPGQMQKLAPSSLYVFNNSYQRASKFWFYTGKMTYSLNHYAQRRNNYNFWPVEDSVFGKPVYLLDVYNLPAFTDSIQIPGWTLGYRYDSSFHSFAKVFITPTQTNYVMQENDSLEIEITAFLPLHYQQYLDAHKEIDQLVIIGVFRERDLVKNIDTKLTIQQLKNKPDQVIRLATGLPKGEYILRFAIGSDSGLFTHNSEKIKLKIN